MTLHAIVLAGGASLRMGQPKALLSLSGRAFLDCVVDALRGGGAGDVVVVTGRHDAEIRAHVASMTLPPRVASNRAYESGQLSSLLVGLDAVERPGVDAVIVALVDHPRVRAATVRLLVDTWRAKRPPVVRPLLGGKHGHPVIFDRCLFPLLRAAPIDEGARAVLRAVREQVVDVAVDDPGVCEDVDTPEDYARLSGL